MRKSRNEFSYELNGFSIIEITVVLAVLSTLSAITIPNIIKTVKLSNIDGAKSLMDFYASDCLEKFRLGKNLSNESPDLISNDKLNTLGYKIGSSSNCENVEIIPTNANDKLYFSLDFRIGSESGKLIKTAIPPVSSDSLNSCKSWAGDLCSDSSSNKSKWTQEFAYESQKKACNQTFYEWMQKSPTGSNNQWDEGSKSCTKQTWVYKNYIASTAAEYQSIKSNAECSEDKEKYSSYTGEKFIDNCNKTYYFFKGVDMGSKDLMKAKQIEEEEAACKVKQEEKRLTGSNGKQSGETSAGLCGDFYWICNQKILTSLAQYKESSCYSES